MLNTLRKGAATWVAKIFIGLLVLSFAVWGVADVFSGYGNRILAKVGEVEISPDQFQRVYQSQIRQLSNQFGQQISGEQARAFGLDRQVLNSLITNAAVDSHGKQLGLGISDKAIQSKIIANPAFRGDDGKFSPIQFTETLRNLDLNEQSFLVEQRTGAVRDQLILTLSSDLHIPQTMRDIQNRFDNNTRTIEFFVLPMSAVKDVGKPDEAAQKAFLDSNKRTFTAPEYRKLGVLTLSPELVEKSIKVTKEDIEANYNERLDQFSIPGQRHIRRMSFIDRTQADEAKAALDKGGDFMDVAKSFGFKEEGTDLGFIDKSDLKEPRIADAAFSLKEGTISGPLPTALSTVIVQVVKVKPGKIQKKLVDVEKEIRTFLIKELATEKLGTLHDTIEDERAGGRVLSEIAESLSLSYTVIEQIDRSGNGPDGKSITAVQTNPTILRSVFESDIGVENEPVEGANGIVNWFEVQKVMPERLKTLDEVKEQLIGKWQDQERESGLNKLATDTMKSLRDGEPLDNFAKKYKAEIKVSKPFKRTEEHDEVPASAVNQAFVLPVGGVGMNSLPENKGRIIFKVKAKEVAKEPAKQDAEKLVSRLDIALGRDLVSQYITGLRDTFGVDINQNALQRLQGVTTGQ